MPTEPLALPANLGAPATRALTAEGYTDLRQFDGVPASDLLQLHGVGPRAISRLQEALVAHGLSLA